MGSLASDIAGVLGKRLFSLRWPQMWPLARICSDKCIVLWSTAALSMSASCLAVEIKASHR